MKQKTKKTIAKRTKTRPSGLVERTVVSNQHLRGRKSKRQRKNTKQGTTAVSTSDIKLI